MTTPSASALQDTLPPTHRLALAYAPRQAHEAWLGLLALDARLAGVVRAARERVLGQLRRAWWRERLAEDNPPSGEPLLALLRRWGPHRAGLIPLVDGWEALLGEAPLPGGGLSALAEGRASAVAALASLCGAENHAAIAARLARGWGLGDLATHVSHPDERATALALMATQDWAPARLPRAMRPLVVLHGFARPRRGARQAAGFGALIGAVRLGIFGR